MSNSTLGKDCEPRVISISLLSMGLAIDNALLQQIVDYGGEDVGIWQSYSELQTIALSSCKAGLAG